MAASSSMVEENRKRSPSNSPTSTSTAATSSQKRLKVGHTWSFAFGLLFYFHDLFPKYVYFNIMIFYLSAGYQSFSFITKP
jgi:hypothetical protein